MATFTILRLPVEGDVEAVELEDNLDAIQRTVGGTFEIARLPVKGIASSAKVFLYCNEDGLRLKLRTNPHWPSRVGDCFIGAVDRRGRNRSLTAEEIKVFQHHLEQIREGA